MRTQRLPLVIPKDLYERLLRLAEAHDRDPWLEARWLLREAVARAEAQSPQAETEGVRDVGATR